MCIVPIDWPANRPKQHAQSGSMNFNKILVPVAILVLTIGAWRQFGWAGIALAAAGVVMWVLLHFTRLMHILKKAADRPIGHVASAVMLHARLQKGMALVHVIAMTKSLGELQTPKDQQPEIFTWTDGGQSSVTCTFMDGKLLAWSLQRPPSDTVNDTASDAASTHGTAGHTSPPT